MSSQTRTHRRAAPIAGAALLAMAGALPGLSAGVAAQGEPRGPVELERVRALGFDSLRAGAVVYYAPGFGEQGKSLGRLVGGALRFFADSLGVEADLRLVVLGRDEWPLLSDHPYGLPYVSTRGDVSLAVLPGAGDGVVHAAYMDWKAELPASVRARLEDQGVTWDEAARRMVALIGLHEVGHAIARVHGVRPTIRWLDEVVASYLAYAFLSARRPDQAALWDLMVDATVETRRPGHHTLEDFEELYTRVGVADYVWYQSMFALRARSLVRAAGLGFLHEVAVVPLVHAGETPSNAEAIRRLEGLAPGFRSWARAFETTEP